MNRGKIYDCVTFFDNNFMFDLRYNILKDVVVFFVICESKYDHRGKKKKISFKLTENYDEKKIKHFILDKPFLEKNSIWQNQATQREFLLESLNFLRPDDYILFSDPDEIPNPEILLNLNLDKKYGIFLQRCFNYKFNLFNKHETPWEGTRVCKKKNLKSIDFMRQKVKSKNLNSSFFRIDKEKSIKIFDNAGWHFNNILSPEEISLKLRTFAHSEFSDSKYSSSEVIKSKINSKIDLFERGHTYEKVELNESFPKYLIENKIKYKDFLL